jgi:hypothetical protein
MWMERMRKVCCWCCLSRRLLNPYAEVLDGEKKQKKRKVSSSVEKGNKFKSFEQILLEEVLKSWNSTRIRIEHCAQNYSSYPAHVPTYQSACA